MANNLHFLAMIISVANLIFLPSISTQSIPSDNLATPSISAAPALLPHPPQLSPYTEISPDIAPLLPSPGRGSARAPAGSSVPTIPSTRSPNPDTMIASIGPDTSIVPSGPVQDSSAVSQVLVKGLSVDVLCGCFAYWLVVFLMI